MFVPTWKFVMYIKVTIEDGVESVSNPYLARGSLEPITIPPANGRTTPTSGREGRKGSERTGQECIHICSSRIMQTLLGEE
jgi:hypothetical protein